MNIYLLELVAYIQAASASSLSIGTGSKTFVLAADIRFIVGMTVTAVYDGSNSMTGTVTSYDPTTKTLVLNITSVTGSGTRASWVIGGTTTLRYSTSPGYNKDASNYYEPRIAQPGNIRRSAFAEGTTGGPIEVGPALRAPNGVIQDSNEFWVAGKPYYDPNKIVVPTLIVHGEWDRDTPPYMAQTLFPLLVNAPTKRYVALGEATHTVIMEKNRMELFRAVQSFLEEESRS